MRKIITIMQREYLTRVKSKAFIIGTFLFPILIGALMVVPILASTSVEKEKVVVFVEDPQNLMFDGLVANSDENVTFQRTVAPFEDYKNGNLLSEGQLALQITPNMLQENDIRAQLFSKKKVILQVKNEVEGTMRKVIRDAKLRQAGISEEALEATKFSLRVSTLKVDELGKQESSSTEAAAAAGYVMAFLIYIMLIIYGMFVMRGVIEEKTNRIVEVVISTVKPFQLMMGKLLGICAVGITQIVMWGILVTVIMVVVSGLVLSNLDIDPAMMQKGMAQMQNSGVQMPEQAEILQGVMNAVSAKNILLFLFYFLGGYLLYGALFAAVGSAVDQESDAQQFTFPVMLPLILPMTMIGNVLQNPNGTLSVVMSHIPFTSPIIMMMRQASVEVPWYEILISMALLVLGIIACVWLAGRIYRVGILMYGKKVSFAEIGRWIFKY